MKYMDSEKWLYIFSPQKGKEIKLLKNDNYYHLFYNDSEIQEIAECSSFQYYTILGISIL
jgi:hypothetical protein